MAVKTLTKHKVLRPLVLTLAGLGMLFNTLFNGYVPTDQSVALGGDSLNQPITQQGGDSLS
jgi:hypothetical protein